MQSQWTVCTGREANADADALLAKGRHVGGRVSTPYALPREYPLCTADTAFTPGDVGPCMGVVGAAQTTQRCPAAFMGSGAQQERTAECDDWAYGASSVIMDRLRSTNGLDFDQTCGTSPATLGALEKTGKCVPCSSVSGPPCVSANKIGTNPLLVNDVALGAAATKPTTTLFWQDFPLQTLHKIWGDGEPANSVNNGVHSRNVYVSPNQETVQCTPDVAAKLQWVQPSVVANVLVLEAHGNAYKGDKSAVKVPGIVRDPKDDLKPSPASSSGAAMPVSQTYSDSALLSSKVGGIVTTRQAYGPGVYNVLAYVSPTSDADAGGRGYVFAVWPFHYAEVYYDNDAAQHDAAQHDAAQHDAAQNDQPSQARGDLKGPASDPNFPCFAQCDGGTADSNKCVTTCSGSETDLFDVINHEIDIEIPSNAPGAATANDPTTGKDLDWVSRRTWDTMNINTWINDIGNYDMATGAYYQNLGVKLNPSLSLAGRTGNRSSSSGPSGPESSFVSTDGFWHWYTIDWYVDNEDYTQNYVRVYFDDPFDPSGKAVYNNQPLPRVAKGPPLARTKRCVPTRFGRLNIGPWFGHWGYNAKATNPANFDTAYVGVAHISISPYNTNTDPSSAPTSGFLFPQSYDQAYVDGDGNTITLAQDFADFYSHGATPVPPLSPIFPPAFPTPPVPTPPVPTPPVLPPAASSGMSPLAITFIVLACLLVVAAAIALPILLVQANKAQSKK